jgi:2-amino-4-hydroxy-6-hydroxymethyldihydropteridine diphosphokinase
VQSWVALSLGTNVGARQSNLRVAVDSLRGFLTEVKTSSIYETEPVGFLDQPQFLNMVLLGYSELSPLKILERTKKIEEEAGRVRTFKNGPRILDIDILLYGHLEGDLYVHQSKDLTVPHPRMHERAFVLVPLKELIPNQMHPVLGKKIYEIDLENELQGVKKVQ